MTHEEVRLGATRGGGTNRVRSPATREVYRPSTRQVLADGREGTCGRKLTERSCKNWAVQDAKCLVMSFSRQKNGTNSSHLDVGATGGWRGRGSLHDTYSLAAGPSHSQPRSSRKKTRSYRHALDRYGYFCASRILRVPGAPRRDDILGRVVHGLRGVYRLRNRLLPLRSQLHVIGLRRSDYDAFLEIAGTARNGKWNAPVWGFDRHDLRCLAMVDSG
jgi:hypothetical protein